MKVIIAGGRDFNQYSEMVTRCKHYFKNTDNVEIVSGNAKGADFLGERFAKENEYSLKLFPADWNKHGKPAGILRNIDMADYADALIAFWDGKSRGTKHMIDIAEQQGLETRIIKYNRK